MLIFHCCHRAFWKAQSPQPKNIYSCLYLLKAISPRHPLHSFTSVRSRPCTQLCRAHMPPAMLTIIAYSLSTMSFRVYILALRLISSMSIILLVFTVYHANCIRTNSTSQRLSLYESCSKLMISCPSVPVSYCIG